MKICLIYLTIAKVTRDAYLVDSGKLKHIGQIFINTYVVVSYMCTGVIWVEL